MITVCKSNVTNDSHKGKYQCLSRYHSHFHTNNQSPTHKSALLQNTSNENHETNFVCLYTNYWLLDKSQNMLCNLVHFIVYGQIATFLLISFDTLNQTSLQRTLQLMVINIRRSNRFFTKNVSALPNVSDKKTVPKHTWQMTELILYCDI